MRVPRGLKKTLKATSPVKLVGTGKFRGFELLQQGGVKTGVKLAGLTKRLDSKLFSHGTFPSHAIRGAERGGWKGKSGGRRRGAAVDAQLSKAINSGKVLPKKGQFSLTKLVLVSLAEAGLVPVMAQRGVAAAAQRLATAADAICYNASTRRLVVVELKCGFSGSRNAAARANGTACTMRAPLAAAPDSCMNRHFAQLAVTTHLLEAETSTLHKAASLGVEVDRVEAVLLYANELSVDLMPLPDWWRARAAKIVKALA